MLSIQVNKIPPSAAQLATRENAFDEASLAVRHAFDQITNARETLIAQKDALAAVDAELGGLTHPGVDNDAIKAHRERKSDLETKSEGFRLRVAAAQELLEFWKTQLQEARVAWTRARADLDSPAIDDPADLSRLKTEAARMNETADKAVSHLAAVEREAAPALAAFEHLGESGAPKEEARRVRDERKTWRDKIAVARREKNDCAEAARHASSRLNALQERLQGEADRDAFRKALAFLEARRPAFEPAIAAYSAGGEQMASLFATCHAWLRSLDAQYAYGQGFEERYSKMFMRAPKFADAVRVPKLGDEGFFVISNWRHQYADFPLRQDILSPLKKLIVRDANLDELLQSGAKIFAQEYERIGLRLLIALAPICSWVVDRDAVFDTVGDLAREVVRPELPIQWRGGEDRPWRRLSLPSLRPSLRAEVAMIWAPNESPQRLLDFVKRAEAA